MPADLFYGKYMSPTKQQLITNPHDQFFRTAMKDRRVVYEFLRAHLPYELYSLINFSDLTMHERSNADAVRKV